MSTTPSGRRGRPFEKGNQAGRGRPKGSLNKATILARALLAEDAEAVTRNCLERAKNGDPAALRIVMARLVPVPKDQPVAWDMPEIKGPADLPGARISLLKAVGDGVVPPSAALQISALLKDLARSFERKAAAPHVHHTFSIAFVDPPHHVEGGSPDMSESKPADPG